MIIDIRTFDSLLGTVPPPLPDEPPIDPNLISPGLLGGAAFVLLVIAVALLFRSMRRQLAKVDPNLPEAPPREPEIPIVDDRTTGTAAQDSVATPVSPPEASSEASPGGEPPARG